MKRHEYALQLLGSQPMQIGETTPESAKQLRQIEDQIAAGLLPNSFQFTVYLNPPLKIDRPIQMKAHLGISEISGEEYFELIHDEWWKLYLIFGLAAYGVGKQYAEELAQVRASNQIKIPLRVNTEGKYVWFNQVSIPAAFDAEGNMTAHVNVYQMDRHYDINFLQTGPLTVFGKEIRPEIGKAIQNISEQIFYAEYIDDSPEKRANKLPSLTEGQAKVLYLYRRQCQDERQDKVTSESVAAMSKRLWPNAPLTQAAVSSHSRDIRRHFEQHAGNGTPLNKSNFGTFREMAAFLNSLFGPVPENHANFP